jgi:hypothetical protein
MPLKLFVKQVAIKQETSLGLRWFRNKRAAEKPT